jgi:hypothetical protein
MSIIKSKEQGKRPDAKSGVVALVVLAMAIVAFLYTQNNVFRGSFALCYFCVAAFVVFWALSGFAYSAQKPELAGRLYAASLTWRAGVFWCAVVLKDAPDVAKSLGGYNLSIEQRGTLMLVALLLSWLALDNWMHVLRPETQD